MIKFISELEMIGENKKKLNEQLVRCVLDGKLSNDKKIKKIDYIVKLGGDINAECGLGYSVLGLAKLMQNDDVISFLEEKGAKDIGFNRKKAEKFFRTASVEEMNDVLKVLPDGYMLMCDVNLNNRGLEKLPNFSKLIVAGYFDCSSNQLKTLEGAPRDVGNNFDCSHNQLTTLKGAPSKVRWIFNCSSNQLTTLKGAPSEVGKSFYCNDNQLTSLEGAPSKVSGGFDCSENQLTSLEGAPSKVDGGFDCSSNQLTSLEGAPSKVGGGFYCSSNQLTCLKGAPSEVNGVFNCKDNPLESYKGKPDKIGRVFVYPNIEVVGVGNGGIDR